ncbi:PGF-pre-PGF domain-containing protein, partial [Methanosalsum natronophilum]
KVSSTWLNDNGIDHEDVYMNRFSGGEWERLDTTFEESDNEWYYYTSETPGFSQFAITGVQQDDPDKELVDENDVEPEEVDDLDEEEVPGFRILMSLFVVSVLVLAIGRFRYN